MCDSIDFLCIVYIGLIAIVEIRIPTLDGTTAQVEAREEMITIQVAWVEAQEVQGATLSEGKLFNASCFFVTFNLLALEFFVKLKSCCKINGIPEMTITGYQTDGMALAWVAIVVIPAARINSNPESI